MLRGRFGIFVIHLIPKVDILVNINTLLRPEECQQHNCNNSIPSYFPFPFVGDNDNSTQVVYILILCNGNRPFSFEPAIPIASFPCKCSYFISLYAMLKKPQIHGYGNEEDIENSYHHVADHLR